MVKSWHVSIVFLAMVFTLLSLISAITSLFLSERISEACYYFLSGWAFIHFIFNDDMRRISRKINNKFGFGKIKDCSKCEEGQMKEAKAVASFTSSSGQYDLRDFFKCDNCGYQVEVKQR